MLPGKSVECLPSPVAIMGTYALNILPLCGLTSITKGKKEME